MPEKMQCPECETEVVPVEGKLPAKCAKCGFSLAAYAPLKRMLDAWQKETKKKTPTKKEDDGEDTSLIDALTKL